MILLVKKDVLQVLGLCVRARKAILGTDSVIKSIQKIKLIFVASDASDNTKEKFLNKGKYYNIRIVYDFSCEELSSATGKSNLIVVGVCDQGFMNNLYNLLEGGC